MLSLFVTLQACEIIIKRLIQTLHTFMHTYFITMFPKLCAVKELGCSINFVLLCSLQEEGEDKIPKQGGNRTDAALLQYLFELGEYYQTWRDDYPEDKLLKVFEFTPDRKRMTTVIDNGDGRFKLYSKGASEVLLELCTSIVGMTGELKEFTKEDAENLSRDLIEPWQREGLRILCLTTRDLTPAGKGHSFLCYVRHNYEEFTCHCFLHKGRNYQW